MKTGTFLGKSLGIRNYVLDGWEKRGSRRIGDKLFEARKPEEDSGSGHVRPP